jgi:Bacterial extracellular solute-binding protein
VCIVVLRSSQRRGPFNLCSLVFYRGGGGSSSSIKWSNWANTGEIARFQAFTADYNKTHNANVQYSFVPTANNNYFTKILTELNGGNAPDVFYVGDGDIGKLVADKTVVELTPLLSGSKSAVLDLDHIVDLVCLAMEDKASRLSVSTEQLRPAAGLTPYLSKPSDFSVSSHSSS